MIVNHSDDGGEIHSRFNDQENHIEVTMIASMGAMITLCFSQGNFNELVKTVRRLSEAFDEGRHERDVQRWIDWAEENRGSPKLKKYIEGKANALIDKQIGRSINVAVDTSNRISPDLVERFRTAVAEHGDAFTGSLFTEEEQARALKDGPWIPPRTFVPINTSGAHDDPEFVFDDKDPPVKVYSHSPDRCPSDHYNDGTDICADCGTDLNPVVTADASWMFGSGGIGKTSEVPTEEEVLADEWQDIEEHDAELSEREGRLELHKKMTLWEALQLSQADRRRIAAALSRSDGSIVFYGA